MKRSVQNMYFDEYEVLDIISETRLSTIYKAKSPYVANELFAIKVIGVTFAKPADILKKEANILKELQECPYIVKSKGFRITEDGIPYLIMGYIEGIHPLMIPSTGNSKPRVRPDLVRTYVKHIAEAIQYAHNKKICHCDIRPENILIEQTNQGNRAVLCDFGLGVQEEDSSYRYKDERDEPDNELTLNKRYLSPERYGKDPLIDPAGDQYSLALVVFECLCGEMPAVSGNPSIKQHLIDEKYSPEIGDILEKAMATHIADRYPTVTKFADALAEKLDEHIKRNQSQPASSRSKPTGTAETTSTAASSDLLTPSNPLQETRQNQSPPWIISRRAVLAAALPAAVFLPMTWVRLWSSMSQFFPGQTPLGTTIDVYQGHTKTVNAVSWSPDSQWIASASDDNTVQIWQPGGGSTPITQSFSDRVVNVIWSQYRDYNNLIAFCVGKSVYVWDFPNSSPRIVYPAKSAITSLAWSQALPANLAITSEHGDVLVLPFIGNESNQQPDIYSATTIKTHTRITDIAWSIDGVYLAACSDSNSPYLWIWDVSDGSQQQSVKLSDAILSIAWSPSPKEEYMLAVGLGNEDANMQVLNAFDSAIPPENFQHREISTGIDVITWSPKTQSSIAGSYLAAGSDSGYVYVWNAQTGLYQPYDQHLQNSSISRRSINVGINIKALAWSPDGTMIASGGTDSTVRVWTSGIGTF